jgi:hypothetical protein
MTHLDNETKELYAHLLDSLGLTNTKQKHHHQTGTGRRSVDLTDPKSQVTCAQCGKVYKRITPTHLKNSCTESITIAEYATRYPNSPIVSENLKSLCGVTEANMCEKYGEEEGKIRWKHYCDLQAETNSFEYKAEKFGMTLDEFNEYNKSRSVTLENLIARHGKKLGTQKWNEYCDRQRYTTSLPYFIEEYGEETGTEKYTEFCKKRAFADKSQSRIQKDVYLELQPVLEGLLPEVRIDTLEEGDFSMFGSFDYGNRKRKKLIEFNGTYWHADHRVYDIDWINPTSKKRAIDIWRHDLLKEDYAKSSGYEVFVIWEEDWYNDKNSIINNITEWYYATN